MKLTIKDAFRTLSQVLLLLVVIALLSLGIAYYVSGVLPFSASQLELVH